MRGLGDTRGRPDAGGGGPAIRHRRRAPPRLLAHGLYLRVGRRRECPGQHEREIPQRRRDVKVHPGGAAGRGARAPSGDHLRRRLPVLDRGGDDGDAQAHDPLPQHGPLPWRPGPRQLPLLLGGGGRLRICRRCPRFSWSTTTHAPAPSSPCASFRRARRWSSASSPPNATTSNPRTTSSAVSMRPVATSASSSSASPRCSFSSTAEGNALTRERQAAKLRLIVETAEEVWGQGA